MDYERASVGIILPGNDRGETSLMDVSSHTGADCAGEGN